MPATAVFNRLHLYPAGKREGTMTYKRLHFPDAPKTRRAWRAYANRLHLRLRIHGSEEGARRFAYPDAELTLLVESFRS